MLKPLSLKSKWSFLFLIVCFYSCNELDENTKKEDVQKREITRTEVEIYKKCIDLIKKSNTYGYINSQVQKKHKISSAFSISTINNFNNEIREDSTYKKVFLKSQFKEMDKFIDNQSINDTRLSLLDTLVDNHDRNILISFSKPHEKFITAFVQNLQKFGSTYKTSENIQGNILFLIENSEIVKYYERTAIFEIY